ncbi:hypothetical protein ROHU_004692 [Labeo rohita]|uniref:Uncharacterized protein n=1 Tax=Labeo rohita TaxID=84645 RepID=A0A498NKB4_LABRO|nr:hypothetical protein ROHU_023992 [Labeo rohita]RXN32196.1 hypothetical protein ROHU_004692 [Labeo rohita]
MGTATFSGNLFGLSALSGDLVIAGASLEDAVGTGTPSGEGEGTGASSEATVRTASSDNAVEAGAPLGELVGAGTSSEATVETGAPSEDLAGPDPYGKQARNPGRRLGGPRRDMRAGSRANQTFPVPDRPRKRLGP